MLLKKFGSFSLLLGFLSSITCQGASGTGNISGGKGEYIYIENAGQSNEELGDEEAEGKEEFLPGKVKNKLEQAKDFISQNPVQVGVLV